MTDTTQRDAFWDALFDLAVNDRDIVVVTADMGAPALDRFRKELPGRFVNVGIAEQNGVLIASGLAMAGKRPYLYAIAPFITLRCLEQIRVNCSIMGFPMVLVGVGVGFGYADSGPTHHLIEDISIMRALPGVTTYSVTDSVMARALAHETTRAKDTVYLRLERPTWPSLYPDNSSFASGITAFRHQGDCIILATGSMVHSAMEAATTLAGEGITCRVADVYRYPVDAGLLAATVDGCHTIFTLEEHMLPGGFGSMIGETLLDTGRPVRLSRIGISHQQGYCYEYGGREAIREHYHLTTRDIVSHIRRTLQNPVA